MSSLEGEQAKNGTELELNFSGDGERLERNDASADSSLNSDVNSSEDGQNNPALQLDQVPLEKVEALGREVEAINYSSTTADIEKTGIPIAIMITPAFGEIPDKTPKSEILDGVSTRKTDTLSSNSAYGTLRSRSRSGSPGPSPLGGKQNGTKTLVKKVSEIAVVVAVIAVVWIVMLLPLVFYHLPQDPVTVETIAASGDCSSPEVYSGICQGFLQQQQQTCLGVTGNGVSVPQGRGDEMQAQLFVTGLPAFLTLSPGCDAVIEQFLCFYIFGLCDSSGELYLPSSGECRMVTEETCGPELEQAMMLIAGLPGIQLPQCNSLPDVDSRCLGNLSSSMTTNTSEAEPVTTPTNVNSSEMELVCNEGFFVGELSGASVCRPECGEWEEFPHSAVVTVDFFIILFSVVYLIGATLVIILSIIQRKRMFKFPSIFIVYGNITLGVFEFFVLIGYFDRKALFCSSQDLEESAANPTGFCSVQGVVQYYTVLLQTMIWLCHVLAIFWTVKFPLSAKNFESKGYFLFVHIGMVVVALVIPVIPVAIVFGTGGFTLTRFPPLICFARNVDVTFYALNLPLCILLATGITLIVLIFYALYALLQGQVTAQKKGSLKALLQSRLHINPAELKILIVFVYSIIFAAIGVIVFMIGSRNAGAFLNQLTTYFGCEALGIQPGQMCQREFDRTALEVLIDITLFFTSIYPIVSLIYVVNVQELKAFYNKRCMGRQMRSSTAGPTPSSQTHSTSTMLPKVITSS